MRRTERMMENIAGQKDDDFNPRRQASFVNRTFAASCCLLFLFWTTQFRNASYMPIASSGISTESATVANDEQNATLLEIASLEAKTNEDEESSVASLKLVLLVDLNAATKAELTNLPGIGETLAGRIVEYRESIGAFVDVEELLEVKGIGPKKFAALRPFCVVGKEEESE